MTSVFRLRRGVKSTVTLYVNSCIKQWCFTENRYPSISSYFFTSKSYNMNVDVFKVNRTIKGMNDGKTEYSRDDRFVLQKGL